MVAVRFEKGGQGGQVRKGKWAPGMWGEGNSRLED